MFSISGAASDTTTETGRSTTGSSQTNTSSQQTNNTNRSKTNRTQGSQSQNTSSQNRTSSNAEEELASFLRTLGEETEQDLTGLVSALANPQSAATLATLLGTRAETADADLAENRSSIVESARVAGDEQLGQAMQTLSKGAGSSLNTLVQQFGLAEGRKINADIAGLEGTLARQDRQAVTGEITNAVNAPSQAIASIAGILKGATQEGTQASTKTAQQTQLANALSEIMSTSESTEIEEILATILSEVQASKSIQQESRGKEDTRDYGIGGGFGGGG